MERQPPRLRTPDAPLATTPTPTSIPSPAPTTSSAATPDASQRIPGLNANGTVTLTSVPRNQAEIELYRVMQRASLLSYYDTLLEMGGDDMHQLCEAGEVEFLEIMALVGMAAKPLHVRRFQKALNEWLRNPAMFQTPLEPERSSVVRDCVSPLTRNPGANLVNSCTPPPSVPVSSSYGSPVPANKIPLKTDCWGPPRVYSPGCASASSASLSSSPGSPAPNPLQAPNPLHAPNPSLVSSQIEKLAAAARHLVQSIPELDPKPLTTNKKKMSKDLERLMSMSEDNPRRMDLIREYSAIYGRFDCKRKPEKPLTLHEVSVNEAAAQLCKLVPALVTRRDELFPLARQVVRDSGYRYSKGHSKSSKSFCDSRYKRSRTDVSVFDLEEESYLDSNQGQLSSSTDEPRDSSESKLFESFQSNDFLDQRYNDPLRSEPEDGAYRGEKFAPSNSRTRWSQSKKTCGPTSSCPDTDDTDSQYSLSNMSSYSQDAGDSHTDGISEEKYGWTSNLTQVT
ncbi:unnamed protein product [Bemisia tabaci]|uniref:NGFI-A-binding protein homolog n=1 Tax=Bemisia tabaci TaxID=7038 RepID=A0A9P0C8N9_BEMTA|nr:unnamed protein product [Bemisia tabaci]